MSAKLFSLPDLVAQMPEVTLFDGHDYRIAPQDAVGFEMARDIYADMKTAGGDTPDMDALTDDVLAKMRTLACRCLPDAPVEEVARLSPAYLMAVIEASSRRITDVMALAKNGHGAGVPSPSAPATPTPPSSSPSPAPSADTPAMSP